MTEFAAVILAAALNGAIPGILLTALVAIVLRLTPRRTSTPPPVMRFGAVRFSSLSSYRSCTCI
jgi:hypothetical protein